MKKIKVFLFIIAILSCGLLVGCDTTGNTEDGGTSNIIQLETPQNIRFVEYSGNSILFFDLVDEANSYQITIFKNNVYHSRIDITNEEAVLGILLKDLSEGEYSLTIKAMAKSGSKILNSQASEAISFTIDGSGDISGTKYNVVFDSNGGTQVTTQLVSSGNCASEPTKPRKTGYVFVCWLLDGAVYDFDTPVISNITLVASWQKSDNPDGEDIELSEYYAAAKDLTGTALKNKLRSIISTNVKNTTYSFLTSSNGLPYTDADPEIAGNIILFYGKVSVKASSSWNREHVWPKSRGWFKTSGAGADIHHIRPEDMNVNTKRGNLIMGIVSGGKNNQYTNGVSGGYYNSNLYEPIDSVKGDIARIYMYMLIRYAQTDSSYPITNVISSMQLLLQWHNSDPVDEFEKVRNERSYEVQGNRNPFIDYPEFAEMIWG
ncbi:MAG TPA: hypothetical protein DCR62_02785 [Acholeplasmatales bacterium]|jgi:endonuclease I|nr:endonuclease [Staphylococcus sp.]CDC68598.1 endonuclease/exonuclease/phosphatase family protein [Staphylococcus sp. CAG:324]HAR57650.1 hypothetical protein [Acholeplasmatales bacterium]